MATPTPSKDTLRRNHALHNEEVSHYLSEREEFGDWVITTAFYAALHWMHYRIFPLSIAVTDNDVLVLNTLDDYRVYISGNVRSSESKHRTLLNLVKDSCPSEIAAEYRRLFDLCMSARCRDYRTASPIITVVQSALRRIRSYCDQ